MRSRPEPTSWSLFCLACSDRPCRWRRPPGLSVRWRSLGEGVPDHLAAAGKLRIEHRQASLEELGRLADPPMTKDAVAGRIRRLLSMADRKAKVEGIPDTESAVTPDLLEDA
jgi:WhiA C-terminal HTH domain